MRRVAALLACLLAGCVSASSEMLDSRTAIISGRGNAYVSSVDVAKKMLVEAATLAQSRGFEYFAFVGFSDASSTGQFATPSQSNTYATANCTAYSCVGQSSTTTNPGTVTTYVKPGSDATVRFYHEGEWPAGQRVWRASEVLAEAVRQKR